MDNKIRNKKHTTYAQVALQQGFQQVVSFQPKHIHLKQQTVDAFTFTKSHWITKRIPFPDIIYDIGYYHQTNDVKKIMRLQRKWGHLILGYSMGNKMKIHNHLIKSAQLKPYLIPTWIIHNPHDILPYLEQGETFILKPLNGWGGKHIFTLRKQNHFFTIHENKRTITIKPNKLLHTLRNKMNNKRFVMQPWLNIRFLDGKIADHRVLIQKNKTGSWTIRATGTRIGRQGHITSNLKSGANIVRTLTFLKEQFGVKKAEDIYQEMHTLAHRVVTFLEQSYRKRFIEFGIDLAVTRQGELKLIEVNVKPGRRILKQLGSKKDYQQTIEAPFQYARYVLEHK